MIEQRDSLTEENGWHTENSHRAKVSTKAEISKGIFSASLEAEYEHTSSNMQEGRDIRFKEGVNKNEEEVTTSQSSSSDSWMSKTDETAVFEGNTATHTYTLDCTVDVFIPEFTVVDVIVRYAEVEFVEEVTATIEITTKKGYRIELPFVTKMRQTISSECEITTLPGVFVTELYPCSVLLQSTMSWMFSDDIAFEPNCMN